MDSFRLKANKDKSWPSRCIAVLLLTVSLLVVSHAQFLDDGDENNNNNNNNQIDYRLFSFDSLAEKAADRNEMYRYDIIGPENDAQASGTAASASGGSAGGGGGSTSLALYKEPSSWMISILKELFTDIDWRTIEEARVQIVKFIHKAERFAGVFRNLFGRDADVEAREASGGGHLFSGRWWGSNKDDKSSAAKLDAQRVKEMLERVACFVGYARLMNLSNEALAELDASKVVTNLFGSLGGGGGAAKRNSSGWKFWG